MATVKDISKTLEAFAPPGLKMDFDNVGFLVGFAEADVQTILVSLDITDDVVAEAAERKAQLIVSHHPLFFSLKSVTDDDRIGRKITKLLSGGISAICMHTNLDAATGGVNDALAAAAGLTDAALLFEETYYDGTAYSCGRAGCLKAPAKLADYLGTLKKALKSNGLRYHDAGRDVFKVAVVGGSGGSYLQHAARSGCDTLVTADVKYDVLLEAKELAINVIDADHFCTENVVTPVLVKRLADAFPDIAVLTSAKHGQTAQFY